MRSTRSFASTQSAGKPKNGDHLNGAWSAVGSSNLDWRSTVWNNEIDAIILGPDFGGQMEAMFQADVVASKTIDLAQWHKRSLGERMREVKAKLVEKLL